MNPRRTASRILIAVVVLSAGYVAFRATRSTTKFKTPSTAHAATPEKESTAPPKPADEGSKVIVYYFHVNVRCATCRAIENYSKEVVQGRLANEIASGRVAWRVVNVQNPENRHFIDEYQLFTKSVVLALYKDGQQKEFKVLNGTWQRVRNKAAMQAYIENEIRAFLRKL